MKYPELIEFIENQMTMQHIYQPLLIRALVDAGGTATVRQLANEFLSHDESQLLYYERRIKKMPLQVLNRRGVVSREGDLVSLQTRKLSLEQRATIRMLCEQKMQSFIQTRGLGIWDYRLGETDPVPDSLRFRVLKDAGGRCALCGISKTERPLDVDHIIPRSKGGKNDLENLQALCTKCNRSKQNKDQTDFRPVPMEVDANCPFCTQVEDRVVEEYESAIAIEDGHPVTDGHILVLPRRHTLDFFSMSEQERTDANQLLRLLRNRLSEGDPTISGFNVGSNCGETAGQTVWHAHIHLIPRRRGDVANPRGGVRGVIPQKQSYEPS